MKSSSAATKPRRSVRTSVLANLPHSSEAKDSARITPSPTVIDVDSDDARHPKKRKYEGPKSEKVMSPYFGNKHKSMKGEKLGLASGSDAEEVDNDDCHFKRKRTTKSTSKAVATKLSSVAAEKESKNEDDSKRRTTVSKKKAIAATKKGPPEDKNNIGNNVSSPANNGRKAPSGGKPDGNGGLNQPVPFNVEYSKSSRATCRTCDEIIKKGDVRVGHTPLFRGKVSCASTFYAFDLNAILTPFCMRPFDNAHLISRVTWYFATWSVLYSQRISLAQKTLRILTLYKTKITQS